jgi:cytochrome c oxidase subunit 4
VSTDITEVDDHSPVHPGEHHDHGPTDRQYFNIFFILVGLTALEVSTYWWEDWFGESAHKVAVPLLFLLMIIKFFLVALFFMHLKWDPAILKRTFYAGMVIAIAVYVVALSAMNFWTDSGTTNFNDPPPVPPAPFCATSQQPGPCPPAN